MAPAILDTLVQRLAADDTAARVDRNLVALDVLPAAVADVARKLKETAGFDLLLDVTAIDWPQREPRFDVVWHFYSTQHKVRARLKTAVSQSRPEVATLTTLYGSAAFMERETHDMYGIVFSGNADRDSIDFRAGNHLGIIDSLLNRS